MKAPWPHSTRRGFTLVELLVAIASYSILVLVAGVTVIGLSTQLKRSRADLEAQRDLGVARHRITYVLRSAARSDVHTSSNRLDVLTATGTVSFVASGSNLFQCTAAGDTTTLVGGRLVLFSAQVTNFSLKVNLAVRGDAMTNSIQEFIAFRNGP